jgi:NAD+ synthase (glutamine-hydrolysing)
MQLLLAQLNATVGDIPGNEQKIRNAYTRGIELGAELVICPECMLTGYPPRDLLARPRFIQDNLDALERLAQQTQSVGLVVGFVDRNGQSEGRGLFNAVGLLHEGRIQSIRHKSLLPTYDVFDEDRYFEAASSNESVLFNGLRLGLTICEDAWNNEVFTISRRYRVDPLDALCQKGCDMILNVSASPWFMGKDQIRQKLLSDQAKRLRTPIIYCNMVGGNDELIFDGGSLVVDAHGNVDQVGASFRSQLINVDQVGETKQGNPSVVDGDEEKLFKALSLGVRDYVSKCGFKDVLLGLSGGIDSALTAVIAADALGAEHVRGVGMPSSFSSQGSKDDAFELAQNLGIRFEEIPIQEPFESVKHQLGHVFRGYQEDVTEENIQARLRGVILMAMSNKFGALLLTTGNKSELAVGYCTLYGDMCGGLAVLSDLPKGMVYRLSRWINRVKEIIPASTLSKPPSAELRPDQKDQDSLPDYDVLDAILEAYVVEHRSMQEIVEMGHDSGLVERMIRLIDVNEYKRRQAAPGLKVSSCAFGMGRRLPIAQRFQDRLSRE